MILRFLLKNLTRFLWSSPLFSPWQSHCSTGLYLLVTVNGCLEKQCQRLNFNCTGLTCRAHMCRTGRRTTTSPGSCGGQPRPGENLWLCPDNHQLTHRSRATAGRQERFHEVSFVANPTKHARRLLWGEVASSRPGHVPRIWDELTLRRRMANILWRGLVIYKFILRGAGSSMIFSLRASLLEIKSIHPVKVFSEMFFW